MEDCRTPTLTAPREFIFNVTPTMINNSTASYYQDVHSIMANMRSYTPIHSEVRSPGISPISLSSPVTTHHSTSFKEFKKPSLLTTKPVVNYTPSPKFGDASNRYLSPCPSFVGACNFSTSLSPSPSLMKGDCSSNDIISPQTGNERDASILDHALTIRLHLKTLGLEQYCEQFEKVGFDCDKIMDIKTTDLKGIGIQSDDCERIMKMFDDFYTT